LQRQRKFHRAIGGRPRGFVDQIQQRLDDVDMVEKLLF